MSFGDPNNPYGQQQGQPGYGYPQQGAPQPGGYPQQPYGAYPPGQPGYGAPELAGWGSRVGGFLIDYLVIAVPTFVLMFIGSLVGGGAGGTIMFIGFLASFATALWQLHQQGTTGQTIGKKTVGVKVLREADGQPTGFGMAFVRYIAHVLDGIPCYIGYLWPLWDPKKQTFADKVCSTVVIKVS
jgi:uncharacterized RDD family membrane protein YckC